MQRVALAAAIVVLCVAAPVSAQTARATGIVRDTAGKAIKGATIRASNPDAYPPEMVSTTDERGRWAMIGLRIGTYRFVVEAPGFHPVEASTTVRTAATPPLQFTLARDPGPIPGALPANIQAQLSAAHMLRDQGRLDQAIVAYQEIRSRNPKLSSINLVVASVYRQRAQQETDPAARRAFLERAIDSYTELLATDNGNARAQRELAVVRAEASSTR